MSLIPFPDVPDYPGVPPLARQGISSTAVNITLSTLGNALLDSLQSQSLWGIYNVNGNPLDGVSGLSFVQDIVQQPVVLSTLSLEYQKEMRVSDFPIEAGSFASYNKVEMPATPTVTLALSGKSTDRTAFLAAVDAACKSTDLYNIVTPDVTYTDYSIDRYTYRRSAQRGATLLVVEISLQEIREVSSAFTTVKPINNPQSPTAASQVSNGNVQGAAPDQSTLKKLLGGGQ